MVLLAYRTSHPTVQGTTSLRFQTNLIKICRHLYRINNRSIFSDVSGIQNVISYSPDYNITKVYNKPFIKYATTDKFDLFETHPRPINAKAVEK